MTTQATIVTSFGDGGGGNGEHVVAEFDDDLNIDSDGEVKLSFNPGDDVYFLVQHDSKVRITNVKSTLGQVQSQGDVSRTRTKTILFAELNEKKSFGYIGSSPSVNCFGNQAAVNTIDDVDVVAVSGTMPAMIEVSKSCTFKSYKLIAPVPALDEDEEYPVGVVIYMEVV